MAICLPCRGGVAAADGGVLPRRGDSRIARFRALSPYFVGRGLAPAVFFTVGATIGRPLPHHHLFSVGDDALYVPLLCIISPRPVLTIYRPQRIKKRRCLSAPPLSFTFNFYFAFLNVNASQVSLSLIIQNIVCTILSKNYPFLIWDFVFSSFNFNRVATLFSITMKNYCFVFAGSHTQYKSNRQKP